MFPILVEGFLLLQYNTNLLQHLYNICMLLSNRELLAQRLHVCKYLYKSGNFLAKHGDVGTSQNGGVNLCELLNKLLSNITTSCLLAKEMLEVRSLLVNVVVYREQQDVVSTKHQPWSEVLVHIVEHVKRNIELLPEVGFTFLLP